MVNNTIGIIVTCPMAKEIGEKYKIAPKCLASLVDIFACAFLVDRARLGLKVLLLLFLIHALGVLPL